MRASSHTSGIKCVKTVGCSGTRTGLIQQEIPLLSRERNFVSEQYKLHVKLIPTMLFLPVGARACRGSRAAERPLPSPPKLSHPSA